MTGKGIHSDLGKKLREAKSYVNALWISGIGTTGIKEIMYCLANPILMQKHLRRGRSRAKFEPINPLSPLLVPKTTTPAKPVAKPSDPSSQNLDGAKQVVKVGTWVAVGYILYQGAKWTAAAFLAPETGGH